MAGVCGSEASHSPHAVRKLPPRCSPDRVTKPALPHCIGCASHMSIHCMAEGGEAAWLAALSPARSLGGWQRNDPLTVTYLRCSDPEQCWVSLDPLMTSLKCSPTAEGGSEDLNIPLTDVRSVEAADDSENLVLTTHSGDRLFLSVYGERAEDEFECWLHGLTLMTGGGRTGERGVLRSGSGRATEASSTAGSLHQRPVYEPQFPPAGRMSSTSSGHSFEVRRPSQPSPRKNPTLCGIRSVRGCNIPLLGVAGNFEAHVHATF